MLRGLGVLAAEEPGAELADGVLLARFERYLVAERGWRWARWRCIRRARAGSWRAFGDRGLAGLERVT